MEIAAGVITILFGICYVCYKIHDEMPGVGSMWLTTMALLSPVIFMSNLITMGCLPDWLGLIGLVFVIVYLTIFLLWIFGQIDWFDSPEQKRFNQRYKATGELSKKVCTMQIPQGDDFLTFKDSLGPKYAKACDKDIIHEWRYRQLSKLLKEWDVEYDRMMCEKRKRQMDRREKLKIIVNHFVVKELEEDDGEMH